MPIATSPLPQEEFSSRFLLRQNDWLFRVYSWYRLVLALVLVTLLVASYDQPLVGRGSPPLFTLLCAGWFLISAVQLALPRSARPGPTRLCANCCVDVIVLVALAHISGGLAGGLPLLLLVVVAAGGLLLTGQPSLLVAALATLALLGDTVFLLGRGLLPEQSLLGAGTLGVLFFATALGFRQLSQRLRSSQQLARQRAADVSRLQHLNQLIVQRMRTGILVVDGDLRIKMMNRAAGELLQAGELQAAAEEGRSPALAEPLRGQLRAWREQPGAPPGPPFRATGGGPELVARCTALAQDRPGDILVFIEDNGQLAQRAQQLKLAALGRLTASIAHEIRNPLGAVSHAAQLLQESTALAPGDARLVEIVLSHVRRINGVIENILQLSRRSPPSPRRLDLGFWLQDFLEQYRQGCDGEVAIGLREFRPGQVMVDPDQLAQVLTNLLDNALRHSRQATGRASAELVVDADDDRPPRLDVLDDGPGVAPADQETIFEPFFTTESTGNGLGLYIARELCEINQARLDCLRVGRGRSCFRISFAHPDRRPLIHE